MCSAWKKERICTGESGTGLLVQNMNMNEQQWKCVEKNTLENA